MAIEQQDATVAMPCARRHCASCCEACCPLRWLSTSKVRSTVHEQSQLLKLLRVGMGTTNRGISQTRLPQHHECEPAFNQSHLGKLTN